MVPVPLMPCRQSLLMWMAKSSFWGELFVVVVLGKVGGFSGVEIQPAMRVSMRKEMRIVTPCFVNFVVIVYLPPGVEVYFEGVGGDTGA